MALPSQFFDPFFAITPEKPSAIPANLVSSGRDDLPANGAVHNGFRFDEDSGYNIVVPALTNKLPVKGQGTISVRATVSDLLQFSVFTEQHGSSTLHLDIGAKQVLLYYASAAGKVNIPFKNIRSPDSSAINQGVETIYWLSIDTNNGLIRYGKYYTNKAMTLIEAQLKKLNPKTGVMEWEQPEQMSWIASLSTIRVTADNDEQSLPTVVHPMPVVMDLSPFVVSGEKLTLRDIDSGAFTVPVNLPAACQTLYGSVAGHQILLNDEDFPNFSDAIQRSCITPGLWAFEKLKSKQGEFSKDLNGTYLRITLGYNLGDSPGIPFVLEIWPAGHYSPIHDHGDACAVIKICCTWYDALTDPTLTINEGRLQEGQITWLGPQNYQIHKLHNKSKAVCCTIQCYRYPDADNVHYEGFNWKDDQGKVEKFVPNSDMSFTDFRAKMKEEWTSDN